jgi:hypothetical protein
MVAARVSEIYEKAARERMQVRKGDQPGATREIYLTWSKANPATKAGTTTPNIGHNHQAFDLYGINSKTRYRNYPVCNILSFRLS